MNSVAATHDDIWAPKRRLSLKQARSRSDLVRLLRMLFTSAAAISAGVLIGSLAYSVISGTTTQVDMGEARSVTMLNPRFTGRDANGQPYEITADTAQRNTSNASLIDLVNPALDNGMSGTVQAPRGVFDQDAQHLELFEEVVLTDASGNRFVTTHARMYVQDNRVVGLEPLEGEGPFGKLRADSYEINDGGDRVTFRGNVWTEIQPSRRETGE
ncbi:MAG: hypothetical protein CBB65_02525 [Hyphomonadaceae bacterium TMED5]|nr:MAG: hypothetical protein CBB65_02525 [Hyphomonadaceae bacterium TMED5]|tara:strand:- start:11905 stop:12546 length:642 start_codon:yes stop_codon:yes gene_type:complete